MSTPYRLKKTISSSHNTDPDDVWATKQNFKITGHYSEPSHGITPYPDQQLINSIKKFQQENHLRVDGVMRPGGETENALLDRDDVIEYYVCKHCTGIHGGVKSPNVCHWCWGKGLR